MDLRHKPGSEGAPSAPEARSNSPVARSAPFIVATGNDDLEREVRVLRAERDELVARISALPRATAHAAAQLVEADKALLSIRQARDSMLARSAELSTKLDQANEIISDLTDARDLAERERDAAMSQLHSTQKECAELRAKLESQPAQPGPSLAAGQSMAALIAQYSAERTRLQQQLDEVRTAASVQSAALQAQLAARKHEALAGGELERHRLEIAELRAELDSLREELRLSRASTREAAHYVPPAAELPPVEPETPLPEPIVTTPQATPEPESDFKAMAQSLQTVLADPSQLESLDVLASQFQDFARQSLSDGNHAAHRLAGICSDLAAWLRKSPAKIPSIGSILEKAQALLARLDDSAASTSVGDPGGATVYAVDDDVDNCECIAMALEKSELRTRYAIKAEVALAELAKAPCDLIILDVDLGGEIDGFEVYSRLRQLDRHRDTPILFVSGLTSTADRVIELTGNPDSFVQKPYNLNQLTLHALGAIVESRLARR